MTFHTSSPSVESLFDDGDEHVNRDSDPDIEKQLDLPPATIKLGDGERRQCEIVGEKHKPLAGCGVFESDATQRRIEVLARVTKKLFASCSR